MADRTKMHVLGPGTITLGGVDAGYVSLVNLELMPEQIESLTNAYGKTPLDVYNLGVSAKVTFEVDEMNFAILQKCIQASTRNSGSGNENISVGAFGGIRQTALVLTYVPRDASIAAAFSFTVWRAVPTGNRKIDAGISKVYQMAVEFTCLIDESKSDGQKLILFGNIAVVADAVAPTATYSPIDDATGVAVGVAPTITFNKAMDPTTINTSSIVMFTALDVGAQTPVAGAVTLDSAGAIVTFTPTSALTAATAYNIIVTSACKSASGVAFVGVKTSFTTA